MIIIRLVNLFSCPNPNSNKSDSNLDHIQIIRFDWPYMVGLD